MILPFICTEKIKKITLRSSAPLRERERNNEPSYIRQNYFNTSRALDGIKKRCEKLKNVKIVEVKIFLYTFVGKL